MNSCYSSQNDTIYRDCWDENEDLEDSMAVTIFRATGQNILGIGPIWTTTNSW